jgi:hypothetical protein
MATDAWQQARAVVVSLWRRVHPERAETIEGELAEVRTEVLAARQGGHGPAEEDLVDDWRRRLRRLLQADPGLADELQRLLEEELVPILPATERSRVGTIMMNATASGQARVYQAGRDLHVNEDG